MQDKRQAPRVECELQGRYIGSDGVERRCVTADISTVGFLLKSPQQLRPGEKIIAYIDEIGRVEGEVARITDAGFALALSLTPRKADKLADVIRWLGARRVEHTYERRNAMRARNPGEAILTGRDGGGQQLITVIDQSEIGVAFRAQGVALGERVKIDGRKAVVLRLFEGGAAASFI